jgi:hypothetical protein
MPFNNRMNSMNIHIFDFFELFCRNRKCLNKLLFILIHYILYEIKNIHKICTYNIYNNVCRKLA